LSVHRPPGVRSLRQRGAHMELSRRDLLKLGILSSAAIAIPMERFARTQAASLSRLPSSQLPKAFQRPLPIPPVLAPTWEDPDANLAFYEIVQQQGQADILGSGKLTKVWGYNGITPGPTISVQRGQKAVVRQVNGLRDAGGRPLRHPTLGYEP